eukprot:1160335-Pelagomonas_calceolata.AAC.8
MRPPGTTHHHAAPPTNAAAAVGPVQHVCKAAKHAKPTSCLPPYDGYLSNSMLSNKIYFMSPIPSPLTSFHHQSKLTSCLPSSAHSACSPCSPGPAAWGTVEES